MGKEIRVDEETLKRAIEVEVRDTFEFTDAEFTADRIAEDLGQRVLARIRAHGIPAARGSADTST